MTQYSGLNVGAENSSEEQAEEGLAAARAARVVWTGAGRSSAESVSLGNGDIVTNVWLETNGAVWLSISKRDAWDANGWLVRVGEIRIGTEPASLTARDTKFEIRPDDSSVRIFSAHENFSMRIRVDANHPAIVVESEGGSAFDMHGEVVCGRSAKRLLGDVEFQGVKDTVLWHYHPKASVCEDECEAKALGQVRDPLPFRTFGGCLGGPGLKRDSRHSVASEVPAKASRVFVVIHAAQSPEVASWKSDLSAMFQKLLALDAAATWNAHAAWWQRFWSRSWIVLSGFPEAQKINDGYIWQRHRLASGIALNPFGPDHGDNRCRGGAYRFENTRLAYWAMLGAGDYDEMLPLPEFTPKTWFDHEDVSPADSGNPCFRNCWTSSLELSLLMLDYHKAVGEKRFLDDTLLPMARAVFTFFRKLYTQPGGCFSAASRLPDIAGLACMLEGLLSVHSASISARERQSWKKMRAALPALPVLEDERGKRIFDARIYKDAGGCRPDGIQAACLGLEAEAAEALKTIFSSGCAGERSDGLRRPDGDSISEMRRGSTGMITLQKMVCQKVGNEVYLLPTWPPKWNVSFKVPLSGRATVSGMYRGGMLIEELSATDEGWEIRYPASES